MTVLSFLSEFAVRAQPRRELPARSHAELAVDARQVRLDRLLGDEQLLGDLPVGRTGGGQAGPALLRGGERGAPRPGSAAGACARLHERLAGRGGRRRRGAALEELERLAQGLARGRAG